MTNVFILTVYDGADFDKVLHHGAYSSFLHAEEAGATYVADYDATMAETEDNRIFIGSCHYDSADHRMIRFATIAAVAFGAVACGLLIHSLVLLCSAA